MWDDKRYDLGHVESLADFEQRQRLRIHQRLKHRPSMPPSVEWSLTIRGHKPAQVHLDKAPIMPNRLQKEPQ